MQGSLLAVTSPSSWLERWAANMLIGSDYPIHLDYVSNVM